LTKKAGSAGGATSGGHQRQAGATGDDADFRVAVCAADHRDGHLGGLTTGRVLLFPIAFCARWAHPSDVSPEVGGIKGLHRDLPLREVLDASHKQSTRPANPVTKFRADEAVNGCMRDTEVHREAVEGEAMPLAVGDNRVRHAPIVPPGPEMASSFLAQGTVACIVPVGHNQAMQRRGRPKSAPPALTNRILELRTRDGLTQEQLAERVGCDHSYVYKLESGLRPLSERMVRKLAKVFRVEPGDIYVREDDSKRALVDAVLAGMTAEEQERWLAIGMAVVGRSAPRPPSAPATKHKRNAA
jgi:transcriptional regulator with XRE-family HTH domain